jgi:hypothetical protein
LDPAALYWPLVFLHVVLFAYWLGGDLGVYVCSRYVARPDLPLAERLRFLEALMSIDTLPRSAIVLLPVVGLQLAAWRGSIVLPPAVLGLVWAGGLAWLGLVWAVFLGRGTPRGDAVQRIDVAVRAVLIPGFLAAGLLSLATGWPVEEGWLAAKLVTYALLLALGLYLRTVIAAWRTGLGMLQVGGTREDAEAHMAQGLRRGRRAAWAFWALIGAAAFLGVVKPF